MNVIRFYINDQPVEESSVPPTTTVLQYLREHLALTGTKEGCAEGDCGACTIVIADPHGPQARPSFRAVNSCILLLPMIDGKRIYTVEGLSTSQGLHPSQQALVRHAGSQCGYCTPGVVMSLFEACYRQDLEPADRPRKLNDQLCGNLCRCTGYRPIRDALQEIAGSVPADRFTATLNGLADPRANGTPGGASAPARITYEAAGQRFFRPGSLATLFDLMDEYPDHRLVSGATDLGLDVTKRHTRFPSLISLESVAELRGISRAGDRWRIGATTPLTDLEAATEGILPPLSRMLRYFGSRQIKHQATVGGNLCNASPIGDLPPVFLALDASVTLASRGGNRSVPISEFFVDYRRTALAPGELLTSIEFDAPQPGWRIASYKVSKRRELDISAVSAGLAVHVSDTGQVLAARLAYGGMAATPSRASRTEAALIGQIWSPTTVQAAATHLDLDFQPMDDQRASAWYRCTLARNLLIGFYDETQSQAVPDLPALPSGTVLPGGPQ